MTSWSSWMAGNRNGLLRLAVTAQLLVLVLVLVLASSQHNLAAQQATPADKPADARPAAAADDPAAGKAHAVLDKYCARCHQADKLKLPEPAGHIANILDLPVIAADRALVRPGNPDGSPIYTLMLTRQMPHAVLAESGGEEPAAEELQALRDWISRLPVHTPTACHRGETISPQAAEGAIQRAIAATAEAERKSLRFVTLTHLHNTCRSRRLVDDYAMALTKLLNGLTWAKAPVRLEPIDEQRTILKVDLAKFDWVAAHWDRISAGYPFSAGSKDVVQATGAAAPVLRADWLAHALLQPDLYGEILGLPSRFADLQRVLKIDVDANIRAGRAPRAGLRESRVVRGARVVERHALPNDANADADAALWLAYDFAGTTGRQNIFEHPLGPAAGAGGRPPFRHDGARALFHLPNGFMAFALHDSRGDRVTRVPEGLNRGATAGSSGMAQCAGCHRGGPIRVRDEVRAQAETDRTMPREMRDQVLFSYATEADLDRSISADIVRYAAAMQAVGVNPAQSIGGLEPMAALAHEYERGADAERVAAEAGLSIEELRRQADALSGDFRPLALALRQGVLRRADANRLLAGLSGAASASAPASAAGTTTPDLVIWSERDRYKSGELVVLGARTSVDCHLTLVSIDNAGRATVLFPNEFEQNNMVTAGKDLRVPGDGAPYQLRAKEKGRETLVGLCSPTQKQPDGIYADYERQRFTMLGNWSNFLAEARAEEGAERKPSDARAAEPKARIKRKARNKAEPRADPRQPDGKRRETQARTAVTYDIE